MCSKPAADHPTNEDEDFYCSLRKKVMDQLLVFEGKDPALEEQLRKKTPGAASRASVGAIGKRVKKYKVVMRKSLGLGASEKNKIDDLPLETGHRDGLPVGTPEGNKSIRRCFEVNPGPEKKKARLDGPSESFAI